MSSMSPIKHLAVVLLMIVYAPFVFLLFGVILLLPAGDPLFVGLLSVLISLPAGDSLWLEGWLYIFTVMGIVYGFYLYIAIKDPQTILNRGKQSSEPKEIIIIVTISLSALLLWVLPGLNRQYFPDFFRFPFEIAIFGLIGVAIGTFIVILANKENTYASKGVRVHEGQEVITTGLYAVIRHPMYAGFFIMFLSTPIALGSLIAFIPAILIVISLLFRIHWEEALLLEELPGYTEYTQKVRYKLIPKIY